MPRTSGTGSINETIDRVVAAAKDSPATAQISVMDAITRMAMPAQCWVTAEPLAWQLTAEFVRAAHALPGWAGILARIPHEPLRDVLQKFSVSSGRRNATDLRAALERQPAAVHEVVLSSVYAVDTASWDNLGLDIGLDIGTGVLTRAQAATAFEDAVAQLRIIARDGSMPAATLREALIALTKTLPGPLPLDVPTLLSHGGVDFLPRAPLAWAIGRVAGRGGLTSLLEEFADASGAHRPLVAQWIGELCQHMDAPAPPQPREWAAMNLALRSLVPPASAAMAQGRSSLVLALQGDYVDGPNIEAGTEADLLLAEGIEVAGALQRISSEAIEAARDADLDILLLATARGPVSLVGTQFATARFRGGSLEEDVRFRVRAAAAGAGGTGSVHFDFLVRGVRVHEKEVAMQVVANVVPHAAQRDAPGAPSTIGIDPAQLLDKGRATPQPPRQQILVSISLCGGFLRISLADLRDGICVFSDEFQSDDIDRVRLESMRREIDAELQPCYLDEDVWGGFDGQASPAVSQDELDSELRRATETIACAGSLLNDTLRSNSRIGSALDYVERQAQAGAVLSVITDTIFFPWELLYPLPRARNMSELARSEHPVEPGQFWGARFAIETDCRGTGPAVELRRRYLACAPKVALNLNRDIKMQQVPLARQPLAVHEDWARELQASAMLDSIRSSCADMRGMLQDGAGEPTVIYVYCHGSSPNPLAGTGEELLLDAQCRLAPRDVQGGPDYKNAPIVFLNSCRSGASSTLSFSSFLAAFRRRGALGMIGTSYAVPITYGAHFASRVVQCCVAPEGGLAAKLLALRRERLLERGDPVPLLYTLQCHLH